MTRWPGGTAIVTWPAYLEVHRLSLPPSTLRVRRAEWRRRSWATRPVRGQPRRVPYVVPYINAEDERLPDRR